MRGPAYAGLQAAVTDKGLIARQRERYGHLAAGPEDDRDLALAVALFSSEPLCLSRPVFARARGIISPDEAALQTALS